MTTTHAYNYCRHGVYVGGCGADYMCGRCEFGEPDLTPRELREEMSYYATNIEWAAHEFETLCVEHNSAGLLWRKRSDGKSVTLTYYTDLLRAYATARTQLEMAVQWAKHDNDDGWLRRAYHWDMMVDELRNKDWMELVTLRMDATPGTDWHYAIDGAMREMVDYITGSNV